jgi:ribosomal protein S18 acetylase RimI-like enzyme
MLWAALDAGEMIGAVLAVESPGATALVYSPPGEPDDAFREVLIALLSELQQQAWRGGLALLQALFGLHESRRPAAFADAGFRYLAELIYLDRPVKLPSLRWACGLEMRFESYRPQRHALFLEALDQSYVETLDCPGLCGLRHTEDVLRGHRATGIHDPDGWFVAMAGAEPVGVVLTARSIGRSALEVAYMGVSAAHRGQGVGSCLLNRTVEHARSLGVDEVTLAVDGMNEPARRLYTKWGFAERTRRRAWIASAPAAGGGSERL